MMVEAEEFWRGRCRSKKPKNRVAAASNFAENILEPVDAAEDFVEDIFEPVVED